MISNPTIPSEKVRVSMFERIVPFAAFGLAAAAGGVGGLLIIELFRVLSVVENAGIAAVSGGLAEYLTYSLVLLYISAALGVVGICVAIGRMIFAKQTASPSGISYIVLGFVSLVPVVIVWYISGLVIEVMSTPSSAVAEAKGAELAGFAIAAVVMTPLVLLLLLVWSVIPFKATPGRRFGPLIALMLMEIALFTAAAMFQLRVAELWRINAAS